MDLQKKGIQTQHFVQFKGPMSLLNNKTSLELNHDFIVKDSELNI